MEMLMQQFGEISVSIYMPVTELGAGRRKHSIEFKNLLREAQESLLEMNLRPTEMHDFLRPARELLEDSDFWRRQSAGVAAFVNSSWFRTYSLPYTCETAVVVAHRFHLKPMLPLMEDRGYRLLALSQNEVRLFDCTPYSFNEIKPKNVPMRLEDALKPDIAEKQLQFHTQTSGATGRDKRSAMFHGHGTGTDGVKSDILRFFQMVSKGLQSVLEEEGKPLLLAGVEYLHSIFRTANQYSGLLDAGIAGNTEKMSEQQIHEESWSIMQAYFRGKKREGFSRFEELNGTGRTGSDLRTIVPAAVEGRVDTLFVAEGVHQWGSFDDASQSLELHERRNSGDVDLSDFAAVQTYLKSGVVYSVNRDEIAGIPDCSAIFRY